MNLLQNLLSLLIWLPILGGGALLFIGDEGDAKSARAELMRYAALLVAVVTLLLSIVLYAAFDNGATAMQFVERIAWISALDAWYYLGVDGISAPLILLTAFITPLVVIAGWDTIKLRPAQYFA
ncbi:MAG: NADH-quinone oxidoreductase subunit M, partial [Gammaproteobacteria bacterium]|nr:NADH-quinone oxidoreductase subunit M [Gammaproteobacteria bacterium]